MSEGRVMVVRLKRCARPRDARPGDMCRLVPQTPTITSPRSLPG